MLSHKDLPFLQQKIQELQNALLFNMSNSVLKIPNTVITAMAVDDVGQVWFFVPRPPQSIQEFDKEFLVRLHFFKKGKAYFLHLTGKAFIVNDPEEINSLVLEEVKEKAMDHVILVRLQILHADYFESKPVTSNPWMAQVRTQFNKWLSREAPGYKPYSLQGSSFELQNSI